MQSDIITVHAKVDCMPPLPRNLCYARCVLFCCACQCHNWHHIYQYHRRLPCPLFQKYSIHVCCLYIQSQCNQCPGHALLHRCSMVQVFTKVISILKSGGYHLALNMMDNKCSATFKKSIRLEATNIQLIPPHNHWVNAAECAIVIFKEHFIAALATIDMFASSNCGMSFSCKSSSP
jgi:hypothetical protein